MSTMMRAIVYDNYGPPEVLKLENVPKPSPKDNEVLVKVEASAVNAADWHLMRGEPRISRLVFGIFKPAMRILGNDICGVVESVGKDVKQFKVGDEVFGDTSVYHFGGYGEYVCMSESSLALKPSNLTFQQAAAVPSAAMTALQGLRDVGKIREGQKVLINGASGGVGTYAVQIAKSFGTEVTAVCSTRNLENAKSLGADHVVDYTKEDVIARGGEYDLILDCASKRSIFEYKAIMKPNSIYVHGGGDRLNQVVFAGSLVSLFSNKKFKLFLCTSTQQDLIVLKDLCESGKIRPLIEKEFPLSQVPDAVRHIEGHAQGKLVIINTQ